MRRGAKGEARPRTSGGYLWIAFGILAVAAFVGIVVSASVKRQVQHPVVGDHWHAQFRLVVCGKILPPFPPSAGGVHTHGDGLIHIHPETSAESGRNANLGLFLRSVRMRLSPDSIQLPDGMAYRNGDKCPDGKVGTVHLLVNGRPNADWDRYALRDRDVVVVEFQ